MFKSLILLFIVFSLTLGLAACAPPNAPILVDSAAVPDGVSSQTVELRLCMVDSPLNAVPAFAQAQGLFQKYGLTVDATTIDSTTNAVTALLTGDCDLVYVGGSAVANAVAAGHDLVIFAGLVNRQLYALVVSPEIASGQDLLGKTVASGKPGGAADLVMRSMLEMLSLRLDEDVTLIAVGGGQSERLAAMESGQVVGTVISVPESSKAVRLGYRILIDPSDVTTPYQHTIVATTRQALQDNRPALKAFLQAIVEASTLMKQNREETIDVLASVLDMDPAADAEFLSDAYDQLILAYLEAVPYPSREGVQALLDEIARDNEGARAVDVDTMIDSTLIEELENSGFIRDVQGQ